MKKTLKNVLVIILAVIFMVASLGMIGLEIYLAIINSANTEELLVLGELFAIALSCGIVCYLASGSFVRACKSIHSARKAKKTSKPAVANTSGSKFYK